MTDYTFILVHEMEGTDDAAWVIRRVDPEEDHADLLDACDWHGPDDADLAQDWATKTLKQEPYGLHIAEWADAGDGWKAVLADDEDGPDPDEEHQETADEIARLTRVIAAGKAAEDRRATLMHHARQRSRDYWTQARLAVTAGISQAAVSKTLAAQRRAADNPPPHTGDTAYLIGRTLGCARWTVDQFEEGGISRRLIEQLLDGHAEPTAREMARLRRVLLQRDVDDLDPAHQAAVGAALEDIDAHAAEPIGADTLTQQQQTLLLRGFEQQLADLQQAS